jgi:hypothetical protein
MVTARATRPHLQRVWLGAQPLQLRLDLRQFRLAVGPGHYESERDTRGNLSAIRHERRRRTALLRMIPQDHCGGSRTGK